MARKPTVYRNYINGEWVASKTGKTFANVNPADTRDVIGFFQDSDQRDVNAAVAAAKAAYKKWRLVPAPKRGELVMELGLWLKKNKERLAHDATREMGKILKETRGDVQEGIDCALFWAGEGRRMYGETTPSELPNKWAMTMRQPIGVCGLITPWNFPMAIPCWKLMPALLCGNTVVIKPASLTPLSVWNLVKGAEEVGFPPGVVNYVTGGGRGVGTPLCEHPDVSLISFTGSTEVGRSINLACAKDFKRVGLEMGGKNAVIVMDDADLELALEGVLWGAFGTTGQRCTATSRCLVQKGVYDKFIDLLAKHAKALRVGDGQDERTEMGPAVDEGQLQTDLSYIEIGLKEGARLVTGGKRLTGPRHKHGFFIEPTIFADVTPKMRIFREEIFGPVLSVVPFRTFEESVALQNDCLYGLSGSLYTRDVNKAFAAMRDVHTGLFYVNAPTIGAENHLPFGGVKQTGNGHREGGKEALDLFSEWKAIYVDFSGKLQKAQIDTDKIVKVK
jgi:acyl-CoA reductase-like NAD-dependent aldehyde dehydrogenase